MTKQEFLAMSLPYQLWCKILDYKNDYVGHPFDLIVGINQWSKDGKLWSLRTLGGAKPSFDRALPVLHPLSDLTKEIEHKGEKFVPIIELIKIKYSILLDLQDEDFSIYTDGYPRACYTTNAIWEIMINPDYLPNEEFWIIQKLIEWHFNLMDIGEEFIDVNTLEENPYK